MKTAPNMIKFRTISTTSTARHNVNPEKASPMEQATVIEKGKRTMQRVIMTKLKRVHFNLRENDLK